MPNSSAKDSPAVLAAVRQLYIDGLLRGRALASLGIVVGAEYVMHAGDNRLTAAVLEAGRSPGFGSDPVDREIKKYLDAVHGLNRWQVERAPHPWEQGGGDAELERLLAAEAHAIEERERLEAAMWEVWEERQQLFRRLQRDGSENSPFGQTSMKSATKALDKATTAWEEAGKREQYARGQVCNRQGLLVENWQRAQSVSAA